MAESETEEVSFTERFTDLSKWWLEGVGKGLLLAFLPLVLIGLAISLMVLVVRFPLEWIGGLK